MKKLFLAIAMVTFGLALNAQKGTFNVGANIGLPVGDAGDVSSFSYGGEVNYLFELSEKFELGASFSYIQFLGKEVTRTFNTGAGTVTVTADAPSNAYLPIAAAGRYNVSEKFVLGADLGYAIGVDTGLESGFYYRPMVGYKVMENITLQATYSGISADNFSPGVIGLGGYYSF